MNYNELLDYLSSIKDDKFASFSKSLSNSSYNVIGVKNPIIKKIIKEHKNDEELDINDFILGEYVEVDLIYFGLAISRLNSIDEQLAFLKSKIKLAKSWMITDCVSSFLKKMTFKQFYNFFIHSYKSKYTYERRMAYVLGLKQYKDERILSLLPLFKNDEEYMVMMSQAWLLSNIAINYKDEIYNYLHSCIDETLKRKTISKIIDSFRFSEKDKELFKSLRNKKGT